MPNKLHWLIYILIEGKIVPSETCIELLENLGEDISLEEFAQNAYNLLSENLDSAKAKKLLDRFEEALELAEEMFSKGEPVPDFSNIGQNGTTEASEPKSQIGSEASEVGELLKTMLITAIENDASNLHIQSGIPPFMRINKNIEFISEVPLEAKEAKALCTVFLNDIQKKVLEDKKDLTVIISTDSLRFRLTLYFVNKQLNGVYHILKPVIENLVQLNFKERLIDTVEKLLEFQNGLILVAGCKNSGKTTTLTAIIQMINTKQKKHIVTLERSIETIIKSSESCVLQRAVGVQTKMCVEKLRSTMKDCSDVIVIDELDDIETVDLALKAADSGHLVIAGISAHDTINSLSRIIGFFPNKAQKNARGMLAENLRGVISIKLLQDINEIPTPANELLYNTVSIQNNILEDKLYLLKPAMQVDKQFNMCFLDDSIFELFREGSISDKVAMENIVNKKQYEKMINSSIL